MTFRFRSFDGSRCRRHSSGSITGPAGVVGTFFLLVGLLLGGPASSYANGTSKTVDSLLAVYPEHFRAGMPVHVQETLGKITDRGRRFLALCYYMRRDSQLTSRWSWTAAEVRAFRKTSAFRRMVADVERVRTIFAERNPGYELRVNIAARSLGTQISKWNRVSSVRRAVTDFTDSAGKFLRRQLSLPAHIDSIPIDIVDSFEVFLRSYSPRPGRVPTVAVPGLSRHGRLSAFDFKVHRRGRMIAGANSSSIRSKWDKPGWTAKLKQAVDSSSWRFSGPLAVPYEPWHYDYDFSDSTDSSTRFSRDEKE
mgnify:CR=1 FL=1